MSSNKQPSSNTKQRLDVVLPQSKVKTIMKSSPEIDNIGVDALYAITKATELFIDHMASIAYKSALRDNSKALNYKHLSDVAQVEDNLEFLREIVPRKLPLRVALQQIAKQEDAKLKELLE